MGLTPLGDLAQGRSATWGDYDDDGDLDLYLSNHLLGANRLFRNEGGGTFSDVTTAPLDDAARGQGAAWPDYDNDGDLDLYLVNYVHSNKLFRNELTSGNHWLHVRLSGTVSNFSAIGAQVRLIAGGIRRLRIHFTRLLDRRSSQPV